MILTSEYQYIGRSNAVGCPSGYRYYVLLYARAVPDVATGSQTVWVRQRMACDVNSDFSGWPTSGGVAVAGTSAISWYQDTVPHGAWGENLTEGGVTYRRWIDMREGSVTVNTGYGVTKDVEITSYWVMNGSYSAGWFPYPNTYANLAATVTLPMVAGASKPSCAATCQLGEALDITVTGHSGLAHAVYYQFGDLTETIALGVTDSTRWIPPLSLAGQIPNDASGTATIYCNTYSGSQLIGTESTTVTLTVPASVVPTVSATVSDASGAEGIVSCLVQNYSCLEVVPNAQGIYGSTVLSTAVLLDGKAYTGGRLTEPGDHTLTVTATDSRGRTGRQDYPITVAAYTAPRLTLSASRCLEDGTADDAGGYARITVTGSITELASGNRCVLTVYWGDSYEGVDSPNFSKIVEADPDATMAIRATLSDKLLTSERSMTLSTGYATLDLLTGGKGIAFGKAATREGFDCAMPAYFTGGVSIVCGTYNGDFHAAPEGTWWTQPANGKCANYPEGATYGFLTTTIAGGARCLTYVNHKSGITHRCDDVNGWGAWVRVDGIEPQLAVGTAYKTNAFYKGKQVHKKLISFGSFPASGSKLVDTGIAFADYEIVDFSLRLLHSSGSYVYGITPDFVFGFQQGSASWEAAVTVINNMSAYTAEAVIRYVRKG